MNLNTEVQKLADSLVLDSLIHASSKSRGVVGEKILSLEPRQKELLSHMTADNFMDRNAFNLFHINDEQKLFGQIKNRR
jgi:hypothetical protein